MTFIKAQTRMQKKRQAPSAVLSLESQHVLEATFSDAIPWKKTPSPCLAHGGHLVKLTSLTKHTFFKKETWAVLKQATSLDLWFY